MPPVVRRFAAAALSRRLPLLQRKTAVNGDPYLFDEKPGLSPAMVETFRGIAAENYLTFCREYMVENEDEFIFYNRQESSRTIENCAREPECLQRLCEREKNTGFFDTALISDRDRIFAFEHQRQFYGDKTKVLPHAGHHVFFRFSSLAEILDY